MSALAKSDEEVYNECKKLQVNYKKVTLNTKNILKK